MQEEQVKKVICDAADKCGFSDCPHVKSHYVYLIGEATCAGETPCKRWQQREGIGEKQSRCRCVEVDE